MEDCQGKNKKAEKRNNEKVINVFDGGMTMSEGSFLKNEVKCPFYKRDKDMRKIACEGIVPYSNVVMSFHYLRDFEKHLIEDCFSLFKISFTFEKSIGLFASSLIFSTGVFAGISLSSKICSFSVSA